jgi:hypothetical protein
MWNFLFFERPGKVLAFRVKESKEVYQLVDRTQKRNIEKKFKKRLYMKFSQFVSLGSRRRLLGFWHQPGSNPPKVLELQQQCQT